MSYAITDNKSGSNIQPELKQTLVNASKGQWSLPKNELKENYSNRSWAVSRVQSVCLNKGITDLKVVSKSSS